MQTSRTHLALSTALALGLGYTLSSSMAVGYPAAAVSTGSNPVRSASGLIDLAGTDTAPAILSAPADQDLIITDVMLGMPQANDYCRANGTIHLEDSSGINYGEFVVSTPHLNNAQNASTVFHSQSGIRIPAGTSISVRFTMYHNYCSTSTYDVTYMLSGYLSQP